MNKNKEGSNNASNAGNKVQTGSVSTINACSLSDLDVKSGAIIKNPTVRESARATKRKHDDSDLDSDTDIHLKMRRPMKSSAIIQVNTMQRDKQAMRRNKVRNPICNRLNDPALSYVDAFGNKYPTTQPKDGVADQPVPSSIVAPSILPKHDVLSRTEKQRLKRQ